MRVRSSSQSRDSITADLWTVSKGSSPLTKTRAESRQGALRFARALKSHLTHAGRDTGSVVAVVFSQ